jgi:dehydrogenase/reductase SDR family protein 12
MIHLEEVIQVSRPIADCFRYIQDFSTIEQWDPGVYRSAKLTAGPPRVGTRFAVTVNSAGRRLPMEYEIKELVPGKLVLLEGEGSGVRAVDRIEFESLGEEATRIRYQADLTLAAAPPVAEPFLKPWLNRVGKKAVQGMKRALDQDCGALEEGLVDALKRRTILPGAWDFTEKGYLAMKDKGLSSFVDGKVAVVTGPTSGLGLATACELSRLGATVALVGRDAEKLAGARTRILEFSGAAPESVRIFEADLTLKSELNRVAGELHAAYRKIDILIHNAGALFEKREETREGHEKTFAVHVLAPWILTERLKEPLARAQGRVILVSSGGLYTQALHVDDLEHRKGRFEGMQAYARAKRAQLGLVSHWSQSWKGSGVIVNAMHPGWAATPGVAKSLPGFDRLLKSFLRDSRMGADTVVWLATSPCVASKSGQFWFDRKIRPTEVIPDTAISESERRELIGALQRLTE